MGKVVVTDKMVLMVDAPFPETVGHRGCVLKVRRQGLECSLEKARSAQAVGPGPASRTRRTSSSPTYLTDAVEADVTADAALVARGAIHHSIPQLLRIRVVGGTAVQLTGVV